MLLSCFRLIVSCVAHAHLQMHAAFCTATPASHQCNAMQRNAIRSDRISWPHEFKPNKVYKHIFHIPCGVTDMNECVSAYSAIRVCTRYYFGIFPCLACSSCCLFQCTNSSFIVPLLQYFWIHNICWISIYVYIFHSTLILNNDFDLIFLT